VSRLAANLWKLGLKPRLNLGQPSFGNTPTLTRRQIRETKRRSSVRIDMGRPPPAHVVRMARPVPGQVALRASAGGLDVVPTDVVDRSESPPLRSGRLGLVDPYQNTTPRIVRGG